MSQLLNICRHLEQQNKTNGESDALTAIFDAEKVQFRDNFVGAISRGEKAGDGESIFAFTSALMPLRKNLSLYS